MADTKHDREAKQLAKKLGAEYNAGKGVDIITPEMVIEYEPEAQALALASGNCRATKNEDT